jgi:hypothetical protein
VDSSNIDPSFLLHQIEVLQRENITFYEQLALKDPAVPMLPIADGVRQA